MQCMYCGLIIDYVPLLCTTSFFRREGSLATLPVYEFTLLKPFAKLKLRLYLPLTLSRCIMQVVVCTILYDKEERLGTHARTKLYIKHSTSAHQTYKFSHSKLHFRIRTRRALLLFFHGIIVTRAHIFLVFLGIPC